MLLPWTWAAYLAGLLLAAGLGARATRRAPRSSDLAVQAGIVLGLYALWQEGGNLADDHVAGAVDHARWIWQVQSALHLPSEVALQRFFLPHPLVVEALNGFYDVAHVPVLIALLVWLFFCHREHFAKWRNIGAILTGACLLIQMVPVAPPRLTPGLGFVDTAMAYHQSVYAPGGIGDATQLAAMPSVHVAWASFVALAAVAVSRSRWRWLVLAHPTLTLLAVVVTANHWWLDGIVAMGLLPVSWALELLASRARQALRQRPAPYALTRPRSRSASAICTAFSAAPLRRLSPDTNMASPHPDGSL